LQVLHQHQILTPIFFVLDYFFCRIASFASTQLYEIFLEQQQTHQFLMFPIGSFVGTTKSTQQKILFFPIGKLDQQKFFLFLHAGNPFSRPRGNPFASPRGNWECSHLLPPLPKTLMVYSCIHT
jgi:hypothetical protein